jgi:Holliday junction resolvase RusA-like endonuclease
MTEVFILIPGAPFGKQSVRAGLRGKRVITYMPKETVEYEDKCYYEAKASMQGRALIEGPVELKLQLFYPIPASWSKKKQEAARLGQIVPTKKPDSSNCLKAIEDGFTGAIWIDDCQVVDHHITKRFSDEPCVIAIVTPLDLQSC